MFDHPFLDDQKETFSRQIVILTEVYFSANHEQHLLMFLGLQNGVRPTERALR